jgi:hypothetical protein
MFQPALSLVLVSCLQALQVTRDLLKVIPELSASQLLAISEKLQATTTPLPNFILRFIIDPVREQKLFSEHQVLLALLILPI